MMTGQREKKRYIAIGEFSHEANSFSRPLADFCRFAPDGWVEPEKLLDMYRGSNSFLGGMIDVAEREEVELIPLPTIRDCACPVLERDTYRYILDRITEHLSCCAERLDGICFSLHGAGMAQGVDNMECDTIRAFRRVVGDEIPVVCTADLHGNITDELLEQIQGLFCHKEYPHTDSRRSGQEAMRALIDTLRGTVRLEMSLYPLPLLTTPANSSTYSSPMKDIRDYFLAYRKQYGLVDAAFFHGFSAADVPHSRASVLVIADGYEPEEHAQRLAQYVWSLRDQMVHHSLDPGQAIDLALAGVKDGYAVIHEPTDNVGSGCPGDGTHLLRVLLERNCPHSIFSYIYDPQVARQAHEAGVGKKITVRLGGKTAPLFGPSIELEDVEVLALPEAETFHYTTPMHLGLDCPVGKTARLRWGNVEFIVVSVRSQAKDDGPITMTGADISDYKLVCLKSANHFRAFFQSRADYIVAADTPGLGGDPRSNPYERIQRPVYPLDMDVTLP